MSKARECCKPPCPEHKHFDAAPLEVMVWKTDDEPKEPWFADFSLLGKGPQGATESEVRKATAFTLRQLADQLDPPPPPEPVRLGYLFVVEVTPSSNFHVEDIDDFTVKISCPATGQEMEHPAEKWGDSMFISFESGVDLELAEFRTRAAPAGRPLSVICGHEHCKVVDHYRVEVWGGRSCVIGTGRLVAWS